MREGPSTGLGNKKQQAAPAASQEENPSLPRLRESLAGTTMVYVDDQLAQVSGMSDFIPIRFGATAVTVHHTDQSYQEVGDEIREKLAAIGYASQKNPPALILMSDGNLANGMCGWELLKHLKSCFPEAICAGFSGEAESQQEFLAAGVEVFIKKPFSLDAVEKRLIEECRRLGK